MLVGNWPTGLPYDPVADTLQVMRVEARESSDMQAGPPKHRPKSAMRGQREYQFEIDMGKDECLALDEFYEDDLAEGSLPWNHPADPFSGDACRLTFITPPSYVPTGAYDEPDTAGDAPRYRARMHVRRMP